MRIGFDISQTGTNKTGCGYFSDGLIKSLAKLDRTNQYSLYSAFGTAYWDRLHWLTTYKARTHNMKRFNVALTYGHLCDLWNKPKEKIKARMGDPEIIHCNSYFCSKPLKDTRIVYTLYDLSFLHHPECTTELTRCKCFEGVFQAALNADMIVAISEFTRDQFLHTFPHYPEERIRVIYPASRFNDTVGSDSKPRGIPNNIAPDKFWLFVGTIEPRKNLRRLLNAYAIAKHQHGIPYPLVVVGGKGWKEDDLAGHIKRLDIAKDVILTGYVNDKQLIWYYQNCYIFLYPSLYEGFGLPVIEAMGLGAAVITSNTTSIPEVGGDAAIYVNPYNIDDIINAMLKLNAENNLRETVRRKAVLQAKKFVWERTATKMLDLYQCAIDYPHVII